jgi:hypothetical protein
MYIKRLNEKFVNKSLLVLRYKVLKFIVDQIATPRLTDTGSRFSIMVSVDRPKFPPILKFKNKTRTKPS